MSRRITLALVLLLAASAPLGAQGRFPGRPAGPTAWTSLSIGLFQLQDMYDPGSNSAWDFGTIVQFRGTLERDFQRGTSFGVAATLARAPLTYDGPECAGCDADLTLWQALALFRIGGGVGFHQVIEIAAGVTGFSNFSRRDGGTIGPGTVVDPTVKIGYGFGYPLSANTQFTLVQEVGLMVHRRGDRPAGDESNVPRTWATRIGLRVGLGGWR
ncbi:MAG: hypothetical protein ABR499_18700 [Gemmatimonadaceae bacterium]